MSGDASTSFGSALKSWPITSATACGVVGDLGRREPRVDLDVVEARARTFAQPPDLLVDALGHRVVRGVGVDLAGMDRRVHADDVGDLTREAQHARLATTDDERRTAGRVRPRRTGQVGDRVVLAREVDGLLLREQRLQDLRVLDHAIDAHLRRFHRDARAVVVELLPARADADLEPPFRQHVDRRELTGEHRGMAVVAVEDERADLQRGGEHRGRGHRRDRAEPLVEVIGNEQRRVAERFELADGVRPRAAFERAVDLDAEPEPVHRHDRAISARPGRRARPGGYVTGMCLMPAMKFDRSGSASPVRSSVGMRFAISSSST